VITAALLARFSLFAALPEARRAAIAARAADLQLQTGEWLIRQGDPPAFFGVLAGELEVIKRLGATEQVITQYGPGEHSGELSLWLGATPAASLRAGMPSRVLRLDATDFYVLVLSTPELQAELRQAMATQIAQLQQVAVEAPVALVTVVGHRWDLTCHDLRDFLARNHAAFTWLNPDEPADAAAVRELHLSASAYPLLVLADGDVLETPSFRAAAERLGLQTRPTADAYDVAIVGGGPAGLAAAVYGASEGLRTLLVESIAPGGQAGTSSRIENYLGFPNGLSGDELSDRARQQAHRFGAEILVAREVSGLEPAPGANTLRLDGGDGVRARAVIVASGVAWRRLAAPGLDQLIGRGVYYGAGRTEALAMRDKDVFVVGGGNSAGQAAMFYSSYARTVTLLVRGDGLAQSMSRYLIDQLATRANIVVEPQREVVDVLGEDHLQAIVVRDRLSGTEQTRDTEALFILIGADAHTAWLPPTVARDPHGYLMTGRDLLAEASWKSSWPLDRPPYLLETSVPGIFAVGDVRAGSIKRVATAVGEGSMAIAFVHQYLDDVAARSPAGLDGRLGTGQTLDRRPAGR
jgi:thioredoxin reductase (NADPH)